MILATVVSPSTRDARTSVVRSDLVAIGALAVFAFAIGAWRVADAPVHLAHDEVMFALNAWNVGRTGRDLNGQLLPLFVHVGGNYWLTAMVLYLEAVVLKVLPLSETAARLPAVLVGVVDVVLMYLVAQGLWRRRFAAVAAAALLAMMPAHLIHARMGVDHLYPVPFILGWLWCMIHRSPERPWLPAVGAAVLGIGAYSYLGALVTMPALAALTCGLLWMTEPRPLLACARVAGAFLATLLPLVIWFRTHPTQYAEHVSMYRLYDASRFTPLQGLRELLSYTSLTARIDVYWGYFNPSFLFFAGDASLINSTRAAGVLLGALALLLPIGIYVIVHRDRSPEQLLLLAGFAVAPLAAVVVGEPHRVNRALGLLPFAVLIATAGLVSLVEAGGGRRALAIALLVLAPSQFAFFYRDYLGDYRVRSSIWFERNIRGAVEDMIARESGEPRPAILLSSRIPYVDAYWRFYAIKHGRDGVGPSPTLFDPLHVDLAAVPPRSLVLVDATADGRPDLPTSLLRVVSVAREPNDAPSFVVLER